MSVQSEQRWKRRGQRENNEQAALAGMIAGLGLPRSPRVAAATTTRNHTRAYVRQWMVANIHEVDNYTFLAEAAADKLLQWSHVLMDVDSSMA